MNVSSIWVINSLLMKKRNKTCGWCELVIFVVGFVWIVCWYYSHSVLDVPGVVIGGSFLLI